MPTAVPNRKYKDRLFLRIFREKEDLLSLYNAVNGSHYEDPDALETSIDQAIEDCLQHNIMVDFLTKHREEARFMILTEYNEELHQKTLYNEGFEDGSKTGEERISRLIQLLIQENRLEDIKKISLDPEYRKKLLREFNL